MPGDPASMHDSDPLECERAYGGLMRFACISLLSIEGAVPEGSRDGQRGPLIDGFGRVLAGLGCMQGAKTRAASEHAMHVVLTRE